MNSKQQYLELYTFIRNVSNNISIQYDVIKKKRKIKHLEKYEFRTIVTKYVNVFMDKKNN